MDSVYFKPCDWSQVSKMSMKIPCSFQVRTTNSCATVRTGLWRRSDALQCLEVSVLKMFRRKGNTIRTLGQASPISTRSWISCSDTDRETTIVWAKGQHRPDAFQEDLCTRLNVFIKTLCSSIGLRRNWYRWKAKKKPYNLKILLANRNVQTAHRLDGKRVASGRPLELRCF